MKKIIFYAMVFLAGIAAANAQDIHFSQFNASALNLNPAMTGAFDADYRFILNHRNQWASVSVPYKTFSGSADAKLLSGKIKAGQLGGGILFNNDKAGTSELGLSQMNVSLAYRSRISRDSAMYLSLGMQAGAAQKSINYAKLTFDEQYNGDAFDPNIATSEIFNSGNVTYADVSAGMAWQLVSKNSFRFTAGGAIFHINEPDQSFMGNKEVKLPSKAVLHILSSFNLGNKISMIPSGMISRQGTFSEYVAGSGFRYKLESKQGYDNSFNFGSYMRFSDAVIVMTGMDYNNVTVGLSYDINTSDLRPASNSKGGFEISLIYKIRKFIPIPVYKRPCPAFL